MKNSKVILFALNILIILTTFNVYSLELCTPSDEYKEYMKLPEKEKEKLVKPNYCKEVIEKPISSDKKGQLKATISQTSYNAGDDGYITIPKDQGNTGVCWAFSAAGAIEANAKKRGLGTYDFSESHIVYSLISGAYKTPITSNKYHVEMNDGGKALYAPSYYFKGFGQLLENEWTYQSVLPKINPSEYKQGRRIISVSNYTYENVSNSNAACTSNEITNIKSKIIERGSAIGSMYMDEYLFPSTYPNNYLSTTANSSYSNHAVLIVGWNDSIPKSKFNGATRDGAWIIKNSWGTDWKAGGYFYISYDDNFICKNIASYDGVSTTTYDNTYYSSELVGDLSLVFSNTNYLATKYHLKNSQEELKRVSYAIGPNSTYKVYLSKSNTLTSKADWQLLKSGTSNKYSIESIDISSPILLNSDFTIIIEYTVSTGSNASLFSTCNFIDDTANISYPTGVNYYSNNLTSWQDMANMTIGSENIKCAANIYAYTNTAIEPTAVVLNKTGLNLEIESKEKLRATVYPTNATDKTITWTSSNSTIASVSSSGEVTANKEGTATITATTTNGKIATCIVTVTKKKIKVSYSTHVQTYGWQSYVSNGQTSGTEGEYKRLEAIKIKLENKDEYTGSIEYRTHIQSYGWETNFKKDNDVSGTSGEAKRLEAIEIRLTDDLAEHYDIYYRVHAQTFGWLGWAKNGESSGTAGFAYRLEAIQIKIVEKNAEFSEYGKNPAYHEKRIQYSTHVQTYGWQEYAYDGNMAGTEGEAKRLEAIKIQFVNPKYNGSVIYRTHIQTYGWESIWKRNNELSGTSGEAKRLEAIQIDLTGEMATHYDIYYRVHAQKFGWMNWAKNGEKAGTAGYAYRLEGIEIVLVDKGESPPTRSNQNYNLAYAEFK